MAKSRFSYGNRPGQPESSPDVFDTSLPEEHASDVPGQPGNETRRGFGNQDFVESLIGTDERKRINPSVPLPWKAVCRLRLHFADRNPKVGTGSLILGNVILTAAHNLYKGGRKATRVEVYAGINGDFNSNFGTDAVGPTRLRVHEEYTHGNIEFDYGIIYLNQNLGHGPAGMIRIRNQENLNNQTGVVTGYPADLPDHAPPSTPDDGSTQWYCFGDLHESGRRLFYNADTTSGQSGGPVLVKVRINDDEFDWCVVAVHAYGKDERIPNRNSGTRITPEVTDQLREWIESFG